MGGDLLPDYLVIMTGSVAFAYLSVIKLQPQDDQLSLV